MNNPLIPEYGTGNYSNPPIRPYSLVMGLVSIACFVPIFVVGRFVGEDLGRAALWVLPTTGLAAGVGALARSRFRDPLGWIGVLLNLGLVALFCLVRFMGPFQS